MPHKNIEINFQFSLSLDEEDVICGKTIVKDTTTSMNIVITYLTLI